MQNWPRPKVNQGSRKNKMNHLCHLSKWSAIMILLSLYLSIQKRLARLFLSKKIKLT